MKHPNNTKPKKQLKLKNYINWFEIPVFDFDRAVAFYNSIYKIQMETSESNGYAMAYFPKSTGVGGAIVCGDGCVPSNTGPLLYLNAGKSLEAILSKIESAGGRLILPKTLIGEDAGYFALFLDTEGNRLALHSKV